VSDGWVGVDLDGTLAKDNGRYIGAPVPLMVARVRAMLEAGTNVKIFTARVSDPDRRTRARVVESIEAWCLEHIGRKLPVTNEKDFGMIKLYDDRCVQVEHNTGRLLGYDDPITTGIIL